MNPSVCPYCEYPFRTQPELVDHLTIGDGCPKRATWRPRHTRAKRLRDTARLLHGDRAVVDVPLPDGDRG